MKSTTKLSTIVAILAITLTLKVHRKDLPTELSELTFAPSTKNAGITDWNVKEVQNYSEFNKVPDKHEDASITKLKCEGKIHLALEENDKSVFLKHTSTQIDIKKYKPDCTLYYGLATSVSRDNKVLNITYHKEAKPALIVKATLKSEDEAKTLENAIIAIIQGRQNLLTPSKQKQNIIQKVTSCMFSIKESKRK